MASWVTLGSGIHICDDVKEQYFGVFQGRECNLGTVVEGECFTPRIYIAVIGHGPTSNRKIELWYNGSMWASCSDFNRSWHEIYASFWRNDGQPLMAGAWEARYYVGSRLVLSRKLTITEPPPDVECIDIGISNLGIIDGQNPGVQATWRNNGPGAVTIDAPLIVDGIRVVSSMYLQANPDERQIGYSLTNAMKTAGTHTVEIPPEFNKSGIQPITYEIGLAPVQVIPYAICGDGVGAMHSWFYFPAGIRLKIGDQELVTSNPGSGSMGVISDLTPGETIDWEVLEVPTGYRVVGADPPLGSMVVPDTDFMVELYFIRTNPCAGVVCEDVCIGADRYSQKCENGVCVTDALIEANCPDCPGYVPPDPCAGVVCEDVCIGADRYSQKCVNGVCVTDQLIEANCPDCPGYVPPPDDLCEGVTCEDVCIGAALYSQKCVNGVCVPDALIEANCPDCPGYVPPPPGPCEGVTCEDVCIGAALYSQKCVNGVCVTDQLIEANCPDCPGYVPPDPCEGVTCDDICYGFDRYSQKCVNGVCVTDQLIESNSEQCDYVPPPECVIGDTRTPHICRDGSQIYTEVCEADELGVEAWVPSGETCPVVAVSRFMGMAIPKIMYEGQPVDIVVESYYGATPSSGEPATLTIDGDTIDTMDTLAGSVTFRWTAEGVGMRRVCVSTPANPVHNVPGSVCDTTMVSAYVPGLAELVKTEKTAYEEELTRLRDLRKVSRDILRGVTSRGEIKIPATLEGSIIEIGGIPYTVPPGGVNVPVTPGDNLVTIIRDGVKEIVSVIVSPGGVVTLPTPTLPWSL